MTSASRAASTATVRLPLGRMTMKLPLEPRRAIPIIKASQTNPSVVWEIAAVLSMMEEGDICSARISTAATPT